MNESEELAYSQGHQAAWRQILRQCINELGYEPDDYNPVWLLECTAIIATLRDVCAEHGDNDWPDDLNLADVINKHLANYL